jgi:hydrogenase expression/formation protein HypE
VTEERILLAHGGGGSLTGAIIREIFLPTFANDTLAVLGDAALLDLVGVPGRLAFTTDAYVVSPPFFPGGDLGRLAVSGTVNDLAVVGAEPLFLSCAFIIEEGCPLDRLRRLADSMAHAAAEAGVTIVTGDTKVVERGSADEVFIVTSGLGRIRQLPDGWGVPLPGDAVLVNGTLGDHGLAVLSAREGLDFAAGLESDCAPLNGLIGLLFAAGLQLRFLRDATRGGLAAVLNEMVEGHTWGVCLEEDAVPLSPAVRALCEILGMDPLSAANEGKFVAVVSPEDAPRALEIMRAHPLGRDAAVIGSVEAELDGLVIMRSPFGGRHIVDMPLGEQLPRIC